MKNKNTNGNKYFISIISEDYEDEYHAYKYFEGKGVITNCRHDPNNSKLIVNFQSITDILQVMSGLFAIRMPVPSDMRINDTEEAGITTTLVSFQMLEKHLTSVIRTIRNIKKEELFRVEKTLTKKLLKNLRQNSVRRRLIEYILTQYAEDEVTVVYDSREKIIMYTKTREAMKRIAKLDIESYLDTNIFTYKCPLCNRMFDQLADLKMHYAKSHDVSLCPLDAEPIDLHMCRSLEHCAFAFLTLFHFTDPLLNEQLYELYKLAYICARYTFNVREDFYNSIDS